MSPEKVRERLDRLLDLPHETECVEFKTASRDFNFDKLGRYVSALSNEAYLRDEEWGWLVFGVNDDHQIVGTEYKQGDPKGLNQLKKDVGANISYGTAFHEIYDLSAQVAGEREKAQKPRVILFQIAAASRGRPKAWKTVCYGREGDSIGPLSHDKHERFVGPQDETVTPVADGTMLLRIDDSGASIRGWRKVAPPGDIGNSHLRFIRREGAKELPSLIQSHRRILLYGSAGVGKTAELRRAAGQSATSGNHEACFISVASYVNEPIARLLPKAMSARAEISWLIFLDGFDQIQQKDRLSFVRHVESFVAAHPEATVVLSARANFVDIPTQASSSTLHDFLPFEVLDLSHDAIMTYVNGAIGDASEAFISSLPSQIGYLLSNPFFLHYLTDQFRTGVAVSQNKAVIFQDLLDERWRADLEHFRTSFLDLADYRKQAEALLERLAVAMESLCRNWISRDDYLELVPEHADRRLLQYCGVWQKRIGIGSVRWQFQHNGFQEYLAARRMEVLPLDAVKDLVAFGPDHKEIVPSWANAVGFMLDNTTREDVFDWVLSVDPAIAVKADPSRIPIKKRMEIFRGIYEDAKTKKIGIDREKYPMRDLARFADNRDNVRFLLAEAESPTSKAHLGNSIYLLRFMRLPYSEEERARSLLLKVALDSQEGETIRSLALFALSDQKLDDPPIVEQVVTGLRDSKNDWIRYSLYSLLHNSDQLDEYVDVFIEGIHLIRLRVGGRGESRLMNEGTELSEGINRVRSPAAIKKVFAYFTENPSDLDEIRVKAREDGLFANAAKAYGADETVYLDVMKCFSSLVSQFSEQEAAVLVTFFEKTGTRARAFEEVLSTWQDAITREHALAMLADKEALQSLIHQFKEDKVEKDVLHSVQNLLLNTGNPDGDWFQAQLVGELGDEFERPLPRDFDQERKNERQRTIDLLFDREVFLEHIENVLDSIGKDEIAYDDIADLRYRRRHEHDHPHLVMEELTRLAVGKAIPKMTILDAANQWNWEWFRISKLHALMSSEKSIQLAEQQAEAIGAWCLANLTKIDFRMAITVDGKQTSYKWIAVYLWFFFRRLNLDYPKGTLLDMVSFDYFEPEEYRGIEYLEAHLTQREMRNRVLDNLATGIAADHVLKNHLTYCLRHEEQDGVPFALKIICDASMDDSARRIALDLLVALAPEELGPALAEVPDSFKWNVVDEMVKMGDFTCRDHLMSLAKEAEADEKDNAICYLVWMGDLDALKLYVDRTRELGALVKTPWILEKNPLASFEDVVALPIFLELLELSYTVDEEEDAFSDTIYGVVQDGLTALAMLSEQNHTAVQTGVSEFIRSHPDLKDVHFLYAFLETLETRFYHHRTEKLSVHDVIMKLQNAGV